MIFTPEYPTLTPMTLCDKNRGGWYMIYNAPLPSRDAQADSACYQYTHDDQRGNSKSAIDKVKASIPEPPKYTPPPPLPDPVNAVEAGKCNTKACCDKVKQFRDKEWDYDTSTFAECANCPTSTYPNVPSVCGGSTSTDNVTCDVTYCCKQSSTAGWNKKSDPKCAACPDVMFQKGGACEQVNANAGDSVGDVPAGCVKASSITYYPKDDCKRECERMGPVYEWNGKWLMNPVSNPRALPNSSCICCAKPVPQGCKEIPYDDFKTRTGRSCGFKNRSSANPDEWSDWTCEDKPYEVPTGTAYEKAQRWCAHLCEVNSKRDGAATSWETWEWNKEYTDTGCRCCLKK
jgi:hypothetical protein